MDNPSMAADGGVPCACVLGKEEGLSSSEPKFRSPNPSAMDRGGRSEKTGGGCGGCCVGFLLKLLAFLLAVKKSKAEKDPNKPKRPPSAFFVFM
ncbi:hypothetical protein ZWY2020_054094 [Hordeum vulgare]|nr:hypothetical protein ZWY2020_054094 [Hordeum vulgare]